MHTRTKTVDKGSIGPGKEKEIEKKKRGSQPFLSKVNEKHFQGKIK